MKGNKEIIKGLNDALTVELTAINQYFIHARMLGDWGYETLAKKVYDESIGEMKHADELIKRILFLEGTPAISRYNTIHVGNTVPKMFKHDLDMELGGVSLYRERIVLALEHHDAVSRELMEHILSDSEGHVDWLETQLRLIEEIGLEGYLAEQM
jgi:bacterioferritin